MVKYALTNAGKDLLNLFYPRICAGCRTVLVNREEHVCTGCLYKLPKTNFHLDRDNPMEQLFWGRVRIEYAAACYYFEKSGKCRRILHHIKYKGRKELARYLGLLYGFELSRSGPFASADKLLPVPLHSRREKKRGFNQSEWFAAGLSESMNKKVAAGVLLRVSGTHTQTNKSRIKRWENVENCFEVSKPEEVENSHIILVDDVVTTGATLESCATTLIRCSGVKISILTIAYA